MELNSALSKLQILDLYFSNFSFEQIKTIEKLNVKTDIYVDYAQNNDDKSIYRVIVKTKSSDDNKKFKLNLETVGIFKLDKQDLEEDLINNIIQINTLSIMFPYIRSQITLLTSQPGMTPIVLQPIDINKIVNGNKKKQG